MDTIRSCYETWSDLPQPKKIRILRAAAAVCFVLFLLFLVIYAFGGTGRARRTITPTVVFMEAMPASFQALRYLAQRRDCSIAMVVLTLSGWVNNSDTAHQQVAAFQQLLENEGFHRPFPVYYGSSVPNAADASVSRSRMGGAPASTASCSYREVISPELSASAQELFHAASLLERVQLTDPSLSSPLTYYDAPLDSYLAAERANFLLLGPATDAATFLQEHSARRGRVQRIVVGGGAFLGTGDTRYLYPDNRYAELNFFFDPKAAQYIVGGTHGRPVTVLSLDAAKPWDPAAFATIVSDRSSTSAMSGHEVTSANVVGVALSGYYSEVGSGARPISVAVLAASFLADPYLQEGATVSSIPVNVVGGCDLATAGKSYRPPSGTANVHVVTAMDMDRFYSHMLRVDALPLVS